MRDETPVELTTVETGSSPAGLISGEVSVEDEQVVRPLSVFDIFRIGIGPSSSHTVGPMRAGYAFVHELHDLGFRAVRVRVELFGSLGATGRGHSTDRAVLLGLEGYVPDTVPGDIVATCLERVTDTERLHLFGHDPIPFAREDMVFSPFTVLPYHVNALTITATVADRAEPFSRTYYSVGGGFVMEDRSPDPTTPDVVALATSEVAQSHALPAPFPFATAAQLVDLCERHGMSIAEVVRANEEAARPAKEIDDYLELVCATMSECIDAGCRTTGVLPGGLRVARRAPALYESLSGRSGVSAQGVAWAGTNDDPMRAMDWVNLFALAVNEENAAGHRVVTAPTNGAAGVIPAVLGYLVRFCPEGRGDAKCVCADFLLAATAIGALIKTNASIAGAEVGCQGEVGSASAMAAGGLAQALGGTPRQVENAAEIAMEHSLGLTCDPIGGLVQIPCIERNAIAAVKAINAARMAMWGDGRHTVSLDAAIETMWQTGQDMLSKYKETAAGGLAVNVVEC